MNLFAHLGRVVLIAGSLFAFAGCQPVDAAFDCDTICTRYKDCYDGAYDVAACATRCRSNAETKPNFYRSVDTCEACINDRACVSATFTCGSDCSEVVP